VIDAAALLERFRRAGLRIVTAESCTGGMVAAQLTDIAGASDVVERGFVTYSNEAKAEMLGVPPALLAQYGAVSVQVARAMAEGRADPCPRRCGHRHHRHRRPPAAKRRASPWGSSIWRSPGAAATPGWNANISAAIVRRCARPPRNARSNC